MKKLIIVFLLLSCSSLVIGNASSYTSNSQILTDYVHKATESLSTAEQEAKKQKLLNQLKEKLGTKRFERLKKKVERKKRKRRSSPEAKAKLAFGLSLGCILFFPLAIPALIMGIRALKGMKRSGNYEGDDLARTAIMISAVMMVLFVLILGLAIALLNSAGGWAWG